MHGQKKRGSIIAPDAKTARAMLKSQHLIATRITRRGWASKCTLRWTEVTLFSRQLAGLLQAGLPLLPAIDVIATSDPRTATARIISTIRRDIANGLHFSTALARHPKSFDTVYCQLIAVGEASGELATLLRQLASDRERAARQKSKIRAAISYPLGILFVAIAITTALMIWVVPTFKQIFDSFGAALPVPTQIVLGLSDAIGHNALPAVAILTACSITASFARRHSMSFRLLSDKILLRLPVIGPLLRLLAIARWTRALGLLLKTGTPLAGTFEILPGVTNNAVFDHATHNIARRINRGERLTEAMRATGVFPLTVLQPIAVAEESGALDTMLTDLAALNDQQIDKHIAMLTAIAEPLIIILLGALIGGLVIAMYLPIIELGNVV